ASLIECVSALREGRTPMCEVHENLLSFAMVEAAVASVERGERVEIDELLEQARLEASAAEADPAARERRQSWSSVRESLTGRAASGPRGTRCPSGPGPRRSRRRPAARRGSSCSPGARCAKRSRRERRPHPARARPPLPTVPDHPSRPGPTTRFLTYM